MAELLKSFQESARYMMAQTHHVIDWSQGEDTISQKAARQFAKDAITQLRNDGIDMHDPNTKLNLVDLSEQFIRMVEPLISNEQQDYLNKNRNAYTQLIERALTKEYAQLKIDEARKTGALGMAFTSDKKGQPNIYMVNSLDDLLKGLFEGDDNDQGPPSNTLS